MSNIDIPYLAKLISYGVGQAQAASALGVSQGYISQLLSSNVQLQEAIAEEDAKIAMAQIDRAKSIEDIERELLTRVHELVPYADSLGEATNALQKISEMRQQSRFNQKSGHHGGNVIELSLGRLADQKLEVQMGDNKVIMHLGGMNMARAPAAKVRDLIAARQKKSLGNEQDSTDEIWELPAADTY